MAEIQAEGKKRATKVSDKQQERMIQYFEENQKMITKKFDATFSNPDLNRHWIILTDILNVLKTPKEGAEKLEAGWKKVSFEK